MNDHRRPIIVTSHRRFWLAITVPYAVLSLAVVVVAWEQYQFTRAELAEEQADDLALERVACEDQADARLLLADLLTFLERSREDANGRTIAEQQRWEAFAEFWRNRLAIPPDCVDVLGLEHDRPASLPEPTTP